MGDALRNEVFTFDQNDCSRSPEYAEESRSNTLHSLHEENETLKAQITRLEKQREAELEELRQRAYQYDDDTIATKEPDLFQKMNDVMVSYQKKSGSSRTGYGKMKAP